MKIDGQMSREGLFSGVGAYLFWLFPAPSRLDLWEERKRKEHTEDVNRKGKMTRDGRTHTESLVLSTDEVKRER